MLRSKNMDIEFYNVKKKAKVKKKQKQIRLNVESTSQNKGKQSTPLPPLRKINDPDSTSNSSS